MILHIAPDYMNKPLYHHLLEALQSQENFCDHFVFACDNVVHNTQDIPHNVHVVNRSFSVLERLLFFPKQKYLLNEVEQHISLKNTELIHAHTLFSSGYIAYQQYKRLGIPYIVAVRNTDVNVFFKHMPHLRHIGREIAANAQKIVFISPAYKKQVMGTYLPENLLEKTTVLPNGIDSIFLQNRTQHMPAEDIIRLIYVGRIEKDKNIHTIIEVTDRLISQGYKVSLCLVGKIIDSEYKTTISKRTYITWHDQCSKKEVLSYLRQNDIFIMPSYHETFGLVYAEAMSQGLPVIYTRGQGFDGFFEDGHVGYAVPCEDVNYIQNRILDIRKDYMTLSGHCKQCADMFDWQQIAASYNNIYQHISHGTR